MISRYMVLVESEQRLMNASVPDLCGKGYCTEAEI